MPDDLIEKCTSSGRRIEDLDSMSFDCLSFSSSFFVIFLEFLLYFDLAGICESLREVEVSFQNIVNRSDDELDHWCRCIEHSSCHTKCRVIFSEEVLVEVDHWIMSLLLIHPMHESMYISSDKYSAELIYDMF